MPGLQPGGWMERLKEEHDVEAVLDPGPRFVDPPSAAETEIVTLSKESAKVKKVAVVMTKPGVERKITMEELKAHNKESEPWFVVHGEVYDGTGFLAKHPGGAESITLVAGEDATEDFMAIHSVVSGSWRAISERVARRRRLLTLGARLLPLQDAKLQLADYHIGTLVPSDVLADTTPATPTAPDPIFLSKTKWKRAKLVEIDYINHDSRNYRFALEYPEQELGLPTGQHVYARLRRKVSPADAEASGGGEELEGEMVQRAYTPVSSQYAKGFLDMLIKVRTRFLGGSLALVGCRRAPSFGSPPPISRFAGLLPHASLSRGRQDDAWVRGAQGGRPCRVQGTARELQVARPRRVRLEGRQATREEDWLDLRWKW